MSTKNFISDKTLNKLKTKKTLSIPLSKTAKKSLKKLKVKKTIVIPVKTPKKQKDYNIVLKKIDKPNIYILYTGGTIGELYYKGKDLVPIKGNLSKLINKMNFDNKLNITYTLDVNKKLIDSSNLRTSDWKDIIKKLQDNHDNYDGFIILHGTDTLAYTASALSFFLKDWNKPVIVTGSQIPLFEFRNDARRNLINSLIISLTNIIGVSIVFGGKVLRGNTSTKFSSTNFAGFESPNFGDVANFNVNLKIHKNNLLQRNTLTTNAYNWTIKDWTDDITIVTYTILPQENSNPLNAIINLKPDAIILRTYGIGNGPVADHKFLKAIKRAVNKKILVINTSQCIHGGIDMDYYNTGRLLKKAGVITSHNMTVECIFAKLFYLFQLYGKHDQMSIKKLFLANLAGELDIDKTNKTESTKLKKYFKDYQEI